MTSGLCVEFPISLRTAYRLGPRIELVGGIQNMFDEASRTHGSGIDGYGRSARLGMNAALW